MTTAIPHISLPAACFGPLGLTLDARPGAETTGGHAADMVIPVIQPAWMDERTLCTRAHELLAEVDYDLERAGLALWAAREYDLCRHQYCASYLEPAPGCVGLCGAVGHHQPCLFEEEPTESVGWTGCTQFRSVPGGLCYAEDYPALVAAR